MRPSPRRSALVMLVLVTACGGGSDGPGEPPAPVPARLGFRTSPLGGTSGQPLAAQPVLEIQDSTGARVPGATGTVTVAVTGGAGVLSGGTTVSAVDGVATFTDLRVRGSGTTSLAFSSAGLAPVSGSVTIAPPPIASIRVVSAPSAVTFGTFFQSPVVVELLGAGGQRVTEAEGEVTVRVKPLGAQQPRPTLLTGATARQPQDGLVTFDSLVLRGGEGAPLEFALSGQQPTSDSAVIAIVPLELDLGDALGTTLGIAGQRDLYRLSHPAGPVGLSIIGAKLVAEQTLDIDLTVTYTDAPARTLGGDFDEFTDGSEWRVYVEDAARTGTIAVAGVGGTTGNYELFTARCAATDATGTSDTVATALSATDCEVPTVSEVGVAFGTYVRFAGVAGTARTVTLAGPTDDFDTVLFIFDPRGDLVAINDDVNGAANIRRSAVTFTPERTGDYVAVATTFDRNVTGPITVTVNDAPAAVGTDAITSGRAPDGRKPGAASRRVRTVGASPMLRRAMRP